MKTENRYPLSPLKVFQVHRVTAFCNVGIRTHYLAELKESGRGNYVTDEIMVLENYKCCQPDFGEKGGLLFLDDV